MVKDKSRKEYHREYYKKNSEKINRKKRKYFKIPKNLLRRRKYNREYHRKLYAQIKELRKNEEN